MVEQTQGPAGDQGADETRPTGRRGRAALASQSALDRATPARGGGLPPIVGSAIAAAILLLAGGGTFAGGYFTNAAVDDNGGGGGGVASPTAAATVVVQATPTPPIVVENVSVDDDPAWGPEDATVTIVEFSDFQCPYCSRFAVETYPQIKQQYGDKVRFVFRDFPLTQIHENAQKASEAAQCANEQGKFWEYHDKLFASQAALDAASLKSYASELGLDSATFDQCLDTGKYTDEVQKDLQEGAGYGVQGTPSFFINGLLVSGAQPFASFQTAIDAALAAG